MTTLRQKTISGLSWTGFSQISKQAIQFIITVILARLLSPDDFGLLGMATVFTGFMTIFSEMGVSSALIQKQDTTEEHYSSAFWLNVIAGIVLTGLLFVLAPFIAVFYSRPELTAILRVMSLNFVLSSFTIVQQAILSKEMNFKALAIRDLLAVVGSGVLGVSLAINGFGIWSLVFQFLAFSLINSVLLWVLSLWRPKPVVSFAAIKSIFGFSMNLTGFNLVNYFSRNVDYLLVGKFLGSEALGFYTLAYKLMLVPLQNFSVVIAKVTFPAFSKVQSNLELIRSTYLKMVRLIGLFAFPLMIYLFYVAEDFVIIAFGMKWEPSIAIIHIMCFCGMIQAVGTTVGNIRLALGESRLHFQLGILNAIIVAICISLALPAGIKAVALIYTLFSWIWYHYSAHKSLQLINISAWKFVCNLKFSYFLSGVLFCILHFWSEWVAPSNAVHRIGLLTIISVVSIGLVFAGYWKIKMYKQPIII